MVHNYCHCMRIWKYISEIYFYFLKSSNIVLKFISYLHPKFSFGSIMVKINRICVYNIHRRHIYVYIIYTTYGENRNKNMNEYIPNI